MGPSVLLVESEGKDRKTLGIGVEDEEVSKIDFSTEMPCCNHTWYQHCLVSNREGLGTNL